MTPEIEAFDEARAAAHRLAAEMEEEPLKPHLSGEKFRRSSVEVRNELERCRSSRGSRTPDSKQLIDLLLDLRVSPQPSSSLPRAL